MKSKDLEKVRRKIDKLDFKFLNLIKKRTKLVEKVIRLKKYKKQIVDKKRIKRVLRNIKKNSIKNKIDHRITVAIWSAMIRSYISYEKRNFYKK